MAVNAKSAVHRYIAVLSSFHVTIKTYRLGGSMTPTSSDALVPIDCPRESTRSVQRSNMVKHVGIILYDGFSLLAAGTLVEALHVANELQSESSNHSLTYRVNLISARGGTVSCSSSMSVWTEHLAARHFDRLDILFIPGGSGV